MKFVRSWLKPNLKQETATDEAKQTPYSESVRSREKIHGEHGDNSSFDCSRLDQADSSVFEADKVLIDKSDGKNALAHNTPDIEGGAFYCAEESTVVEPHNTGSFNTQDLVPAATRISSTSLTYILR